MGKHTTIGVIFVASAVFIVALIFIFTNPNTPLGILTKLQSQYQDFEVTTSTFQGYESKKAFANTANGRILLQVIEDVNNESLAGIILQLNSKITELGEKLTYFDPYKGEIVEYSMPEEFKPVEEQTSIKRTPLKYHIVHVNEIFSSFVFSKEKASFKGIVAVFSCGSNVYKIEIFSKIESFDKEKSLDVLKEFYCS